MCGSIKKKKSLFNKLIAVVENLLMCDSIKKSGLFKRLIADMENLKMCGSVKNKKL